MSRAIRPLVYVVLTILLALIHHLYNWYVSMALYQVSGGIRTTNGGWTEYGGAPYAWTIPLDLPFAWLINTQSSPPLLAKMKLQIAIAVLGLAWIPVPEKWAFVYGWTVRY